nr:MAG TPA: hypothetical protein [Caudoviricetes sp.]
MNVNGCFAGKALNVLTCRLQYGIIHMGNPQRLSP